LAGLKIPGYGCGPPHALAGEFRARRPVWVPANDVKAAPDGGASPNFELTVILGPIGTSNDRIFGAAPSA
jgi:hypothetical protein